MKFSFDWWWIANFIFAIFNYFQTQIRYLLSTTTYWRPSSEVFLDKFVLSLWWNIGCVLCDISQTVLSFAYFMFEGKTHSDSCKSSFFFVMYLRFSSIFLSSIWVNNRLKENQENVSYFYQCLLILISELGGIFTSKDNSGRLLKNIS